MWENYVSVLYPVSSCLEKVYISDNIKYSSLKPSSVKCKGTAQICA